jgi:hypothetical protein
MLVPKSIVRQKLHLNPSDYYRTYVLRFLYDEEWTSSSPLVRVVKGRPKLTYGDVDAKYKQMFDVGRHNPGVEKRINAYVSTSRPDLLDSFKAQKRREPDLPLPDEDLSAAVGDKPTNVTELLERVLETDPGKDEADLYHRRVDALFTKLFYPSLVNPRREVPVHEGRKRIDINYTNAAARGFFTGLQCTFLPPT